MQNAVPLKGTCLALHQLYWWASINHTSRSLTDHTVIR